MRERRKPMERTTRRQPSMPRHFGESIRRPGGSLPPPGPRLASLRSGVVVIPEKPKTGALCHAPLPQKHKGPDSAVHRSRSSGREMSIRAGWDGLSGGRVRPAPPGTYTPSFLVPWRPVLFPSATTPPPRPFDCPDPAPGMSDAAAARFRCRCGRRSVHCRQAALLHDATGPGTRPVLATMMLAGARHHGSTRL